MTEGAVPLPADLLPVAGPPFLMQHLRPIAYSILNEIIHHTRKEFNVDQCSKAAHKLFRILHDPTQSTSEWSPSCPCPPPWSLLLALPPPPSWPAAQLLAAACLTTSRRREGAESASLGVEEPMRGVRAR